MKKPKATKAAPKGRTGQLVLSRTQVGLALGFTVIGLMLALGIGFIVGVWYQASDDITPYDAGPSPTAAQRAQDRAMTFYSTLTESPGGSPAPVPSASEGAAGRAGGSRPRQQMVAAIEGAASPFGTGYSVQVGSFRAREQAERLVSHLAHKGYAGRIQTTAVPGKGIWYRVRVGHFADRAAADRVAQRLVSQEHLSVMIANESQ